MDKQFQEESIDSCSSVLQVYPKKPQIPSTGLLTITIENRKQTRLKVFITFDSFFFEVSRDKSILDQRQKFKWRKRDLSRNHVKMSMFLGPNWRTSLRIGLSKNANTKNNLFYDYKTLEGFIRVSHVISLPGDETNKFPDFDDGNFDMSERQEFELFLEKETEQTQKLKEDFMEIEEKRKNEPKWNENIPKTDLDLFKIAQDTSEAEEANRIQKCFDDDVELIFKDIDKMSYEEIKEKLTKKREERTEDFNKYREEKKRKLDAIAEKEKAEKEKAVKEKAEKEKTEKEEKARKEKKEKESKKKSEVKTVEEPKSAKSFQKALKIAKAKKVEVDESDFSVRLKTTTRKLEIKKAEEPKQAETFQIEGRKKNAVKAIPQKPQEPQKPEKKKKNPCCVII